METLDIVTAVGAWSLIVTAVVDAIRRRFPVLDGGQVQLIALAIAYGVAWAFDFRATAELVTALELPVGRIPVPPIDYFVTALAIMAGAGKLAEFAHRDVPVVIASDASTVTVNTSGSVTPT